MRNLGFGRVTLCCCVAAAMMAGCSGSQPPIGASGAMSETVASTSRAFRTSYKVTPPLLYVTNIGYQDVTVYQATAKDSAPLATISDGIVIPGGACIDGQGTLYVTDEPASDGWVSEYPLGKTTPSRTIYRRYR